MALPPPLQVVVGLQAHPSRRVGFASLLSLLVVALSVTAGSAAPPPTSGKEHFYNAKGARVTVKWELDADTVPEDGHLVAKLVVTGATNPHEVVRPDLRKISVFDERFQVVDVAGKAAAANAKSVSFAYRLRPRNAKVDRVPSLLFYFYNPNAPGDDKYRLTTAEGKPIKVTPAAPKPAAPAIPIDAPDALFEVNTGLDPLDREPFAPGLWPWLLLLVLGPLVAGGWYAAWRRVYPDAARLARMRRSRAARRAVDAVRRAGRSADPPGTIAAAVLGYVRARYPLPPGAETPGELGDALRAVGVPDDEADAAVGFFRRCDEARFAPPGDTVVSLAVEAEGLVTRLEGRE
jgi:hypothetical protein